MTTIILNKDCRTRTAKAARAASLLFAAGSILMGTINAQQAGTSVNVNSSTNWQGWMTVGTNVPGMAYPIGDLDAGFIGNVLAFAPNTSISRDFPSTGTGAKIMDAVLYVNDDTLAGSNVTFSGVCLANTLVASYTNTVFIREFRTNDWALVTNVSKQIKISGPFSVTQTTAKTNHVEYGFEMVGPNASLSDAKNLGWVVFSKDGSASAPSFPDPAQIVETSWKTSPTTNAAVGSNLVLKATAVSGSGLTYQWQKNGVNLVNSSSVDGATGGMLTLTGLQVGDGGTYTLVLGDVMGRTDKRSVYLIVLDPKDLPIDPSANWLGQVQRSIDGGHTFPIIQPYLPASDLKAVFTNGALALAPNTKEYTNSSPGTNSDGSSKEYLSADYYVEYACLSGKVLTFAGYCPSNGPAQKGYTVKAWIKEFTPSYSYVNQGSVILTQGQTFDVSYTSTAATNLIQYGFSTLGPVAKPTDAASLGQTLVSRKMANVTVNPSTNWLGWMVARANGTNVLINTNYPIGDLDAGFNGNVLAFSPNTSISTNNSDWWTNGSGARQMDASIYILDDTLLGKTVTFSGYCLTNTLAAAYYTNVSVFIREFEKDWTNISSASAQITSNGLFSITLKTTSTISNHVEYGIEMVGPNASVNNATSLGWILFSANASAAVPSMQAPANIASTSWNNATNTTAAIGSSASLSVSVTNSGFNYQWQKDGVNLTNSGATNLVLTWSSVQASDAGTYTLVLKNVWGISVDTRSVYLSALDPSHLTLDPNASWISRVSRFTNNSYWTNVAYTPASDLKAVFTNGMLSLAPNTREYTNSFPGTNSNGSSKESLSAEYYVEADCLTNKTLTFVGYCPSNTLATNYVAQAWIREVTNDYKVVISNSIIQLVAGQQFSVTLTSTSSLTHIQYGFSTVGPVANPTNAASLGQAWVSKSDTTNVTVTPSSGWQGWMIAREASTNDQYTGGAFVFNTDSGGGTNWLPVDLNAVFLGNVLEFTPSTTTSGKSPISVTGPSWWNADGTGARQMDAIFLFNDDNLAGKVVTFTGYCLTNTLVAPYSTNINAFIKEFTTNWAMVGITNRLMTNGSAFSISLQTTNSHHVQYGFEMVGPNANASNVTSLGRVVISSNANAVVPALEGPANISWQSWDGKTNGYATVGAGMSLYVDAKGRGLTFQWYKNGAILTDDGNITGATTYKLTLLSVRGSDEGNYWLKVTDDTGVDAITSSFYLVAFDPNHLTIEPNAYWWKWVTRLTNSGIGAPWKYKTNGEYASASDLQARFTNNGALVLAPNTKEYTNSSPGTNSDGSSREFLKAEYYIEYDNLAGNTLTYSSLAGKALTFAGYCSSNSLASGYTNYAYIKEAYHDYRATTNVQETMLVAGQAFSLTLSSTSSANLIQYGFRTEGQVANPLTASNLGCAVVYPLIVPSMTVTRKGNDIQLNCPSMAGVDYILEYKSDLSQTNWQTLDNWSDTVGTLTVPDYSIIKTAHQRFYRLSIKSSK